MSHIDKMWTQLVDTADRDQDGITKHICDRNLVLGPFRMYRHKSGVSAMDDFVDSVLYCRNMCSALVPRLGCSLCDTLDNPIL